MGLSAQALLPLVFADHLAFFPTAVDAVRSNPETGVPVHNVPEQFLSALCEAFVEAARSMTIQAAVAGTADIIPGLPPIPVPFTFPGATAAAGGLALDQEWTGVSGAKFASVVVRSVLSGASLIGRLQMNPARLVGTGTGITAGANPNLAASMEAALNAALPASFTASGYFGTDDVPGATVNPTLAARLPAYAKQLALGFSSIAATIAYVGNASVPTAAAEVGTGSIL